MKVNKIKLILQKNESMLNICPVVLLITLFFSFILFVSVHAAPFIGDCQLFPANNIWNTPVDKLPVDLQSSAYISTIGENVSFHPDFGSGTWNGGPIGIPFNIVLGTQLMVPIAFEYDDESDPGPYPIPPNPLIEGGEQSTGDRHVLVLDNNNCILYETFSVYPDGNGGWNAGSGAVFDLNQNDLRPFGWTSGDAAGLPILPGLVRYDEVESGEITHAIRFTAPQTRRAFVWPARHYASSLTGPQYPTMGQRFRLKASFDETGFSPHIQVILRAMKKYGLILADNGSSWYISGVPDERWDNDMLVSQFRLIKGNDFEAVDVSSLMKDENSGEAMQVAYLTLARSGDGKGTFTAQGLSCKRSGKCVGTYSIGDEVVITANPRTGSVLAEWNGCTSTVGSTCSITMEGDAQITGVFLKRPVISASPKVINFGVQGPDIVSVPRVATIRNKGSAPLIISTIEITGTNASEFQQSNGCSVPLSRDVTCPISVSVTPTSSGRTSADLVIHSNDPKKPSFVIKLRAKAQ